MMTHKQEEIKILIEQGYARSSTILLHSIRAQDPELKGIQIRFFDPKSGGSKSLGSIKYTSIDLLGENRTYYFDIERTEKFVKFLVEKFYENNKNPDKGLKRAFTRLLHLHGLHWSGEFARKRLHGRIIDDTRGKYR